MLLAITAYLPLFFFHVAWFLPLALLPRGGSASGCCVLQPVSAMPLTCPDTWVWMQCEYYKEGCKAGHKDPKAGIGMAYEWHEGQSDTRNASYFQAGYEEGWQHQ